MSGFLGTNWFNNSYGSGGPTDLSQSDFEAAFTSRSGAATWTYDDSTYGNYLTLVSPGGNTIYRTNINFEKHLLSGLLVLLGVQIFINLLTILGIIPLTGIPFPLLSLGGSSIFSTAIIFGIINRVFIENNIVV